MKTFTLIAVVATLFALVGALEAQDVVPLGSLTGGVTAGASGFFGTQSNAFHLADPAATFTGAGTPGPYLPAGAGVPLPGVPAPPTPVYYPSMAAPAWPEQFNQPGGYTFHFTDGSTSATTQITNATANAGLTTDAFINFGPTGNPWAFDQGSSAVGYGYEQINFDAQFAVLPGLVLNGIAAPNLPILITGTSDNGLYAQFDAAVTYTFIPTNTTWVPIGSPSTLGTIDYTWIQQPVTTSWSDVVYPTGPLAGTTTGPGVLELTGYAYVAGDPVDLNIQSVPEPSTLVLLALAGLGVLGRWVTRRWWA
jgi:hypothetical protein